VPEVHVVAILAVGVERGVLVGRVGFTAQQEGERHKDSRLNWGSGDEQCSQESAGVRVSQRAFMVVHGAPPGEQGMLGSCRQGGERGKEDGICDEGDSRVGRE